MAVDLDAAYARCEEITRAQAKNFAYGIRLLPTPKRQAMSALYAFARHVDDIGDGAASSDEKLVELAAVREQVARAAKGRLAGDDLMWTALADAMVRYPMAPEALVEIVAGCEMDCRISRYATFEDLVVYCRCVAGSVGRLSLSVFGSDDPGAPQLADTLGVALQVTNILRDIVEDRDVMGRVYLPAEDLERFGCEPDASGPPAAMADLVRYEAGRARARYEEGLGLLDLLDRRSRACVAAMSGIYSRLLDRIEHEPLGVMSRRMSLPTWEKAWVAARSLAGMSA